MTHVNVLVDTKRLRIRRLDRADSEFLISLLNSPGWLRYIGDRNVHNLEQANAYLENGPFKSYAENGFGLWMVEDKASRERLGICGLLKRKILDHPDIGFAFLPEYMGKGYATESVNAVIELARDTYEIETLLAITTTDNIASQTLLTNSGFRKSHEMKDESNTTLCVFIKDLS
jgi:[ribosomal protein S5]-alanine N-acetyltransferase